MTERMTDAAPSLAEREILVKEREIALKEKETRRSRWLSPLVVAITVAALGAFSNAGLAYFSAIKEQELAKKNATDQLQLQQRAEEGDLILASFQGGDSAKVPQRIELLLRAGLIRDDQVTFALVQYLGKDWVRTGRFAAVPLEAQSVNGCSNVLLLSPRLDMFTSPGCKITLIAGETALNLRFPKEEDSKAAESMLEAAPIAAAEPPSTDAAGHVVSCIDPPAVLRSPFPADAKEIAGWCIFVASPL